MHVDLVVFRDGLVPPQPSPTTTAAPSPTSSPTIPSTIGDYDYVSCWADPDGGRALSTVTTAADMTNEKCALACGGSEYFGTQWSVECWCGPSLTAGSVAAAKRLRGLAGAAHLAVAGIAQNAALVARPTPQFGGTRQRPSRRSGIVPRAGLGAGIDQRQPCRAEAAQDLCRVRQDLRARGNGGAGTDR